MFENILTSEFIAALVNNPVFLGLLLAVIRSIGGYVEAMLHVRKTEAYSFIKLGETIAIYETFFVGLSQIPSMPIYLIAIIAVVVDLIRSLKKVIADMQPTGA